MTDITLAQPQGRFFWAGKVPGPLCGGNVTWACDYSSAEPIAIPPKVSFVDHVVIVTPTMDACLATPQPISPGVLTLTPTVYCPDPADPDGPPLQQVLVPLYLTITEDGCSGLEPCDQTLCPFPENPDFEDGDLTKWFLAGGNSYIVTSPVHSGTYAVQMPNPGSSILQDKVGFCAYQGATVGFSVWAYGLGGAKSCKMIIRQMLSTGGVLHTHTDDPVAIPGGEWTLISTSVASHVGADQLQIELVANDADIVIDDFAVSVC